MEGWHDFFVAQAGAAVAFAGLVLVSVSINLDRIIKVDGLIGRSAEPLVILFSLFVASSIMLVPDQSTRIYGLAVLVLALRHHGRVPDLSRTPEGIRERAGFVSHGAGGDYRLLVVVSRRLGPLDRNRPVNKSDRQ
jgi:hypothetical protein